MAPEILHPSAYEKQRFDRDPRALKVAENTTLAQAANLPK